MEASRKTRPQERLGTARLYGRRNREPEPRQEQVSRKDRVRTWLSPDPGAATPARSFNRPDLPRHDAVTQAHPALLLSSQALAREPPGWPSARSAPPDSVSGATQSTSNTSEDARGSPSIAPAKRKLDDSEPTLSLVAATRS